jgi:hypothetical protein|tara:strand:+ start:7355 stop:7924 length:570 start_codon:yes stop_codon:yes gene_type:complete
MNLSKVVKQVKIPLKLAVLTAKNTLMNYDSSFRNLAIMNSLNQAVDSDYTIDTKTLTEAKAFVNECIKSAKEITSKDKAFDFAIMIDVSFAQARGEVSKSSRGGSNYSEVQNAFKNDSETAVVKAFDEYKKAKDDKTLKFTNSELFIAEDKKGSKIILCTTNDENDKKVTKQLKTYWGTITETSYKAIK